jgi:hypothetical protein
MIFANRPHMKMRTVGMAAYSKLCRSRIFMVEIELAKGDTTQHDP